MYVIPQIMRMIRVVIVDQETIDWRGANGGGGAKDCEAEDRGFFYPLVHQKLSS